MGSPAATVNQSVGSHGFLSGNLDADQPLLSPRVRSSGRGSSPWPAGSTRRPWRVSTVSGAGCEEP